MNFLPAPLLFISALGLASTPGLTVARDPSLGQTRISYSGEAVELFCKGVDFGHGSTRFISSEGHFIYSCSVVGGAFVLSASLLDSPEVTTFTQNGGVYTSVELNPNDSKIFYEALFPNSSVGRYNDNGPTLTLELSPPNSDELQIFCTAHNCNLIAKLPSNY